MLKRKKNPERLGKGVFYVLFFLPLSAVTSPDLFVNESWEH